MPDPNDQPDPGPFDDLQRETERILRALADRSNARAAQRDLAERDSGQQQPNRAATAKASGSLRTSGGHQDRLAERLAANGIGGQLAETRLRAECSQAAPARAIKRRAAAGRSASGSAEQGARRSGPGQGIDYFGRSGGYAPVEGVPAIRNRHVDHLSMSG